MYKRRIKEIREKIEKSKGHRIKKTVEGKTKFNVKEKKKRRKRKGKEIRNKKEIDKSGK